MTNDDVIISYNEQLFFIVEKFRYYIRLKKAKKEKKFAVVIYFAFATNNNKQSNDKQNKNKSSNKRSISFYDKNKSLSICVCECKYSFYNYYYLNKKKLSESIQSKSCRYYKTRILTIRKKEEGKLDIIEEFRYIDARASKRFDRV